MVTKTELLKQHEGTVRQAARSMFNLREADDEAIRDIPLHMLTIDPHVQVRVGGLDQHQVDAICATLLEGGETDPVDVFEVEGEKILTNGFHRAEGHKLANKYSIRVRIHKGSYEDALRFAEEANLRNAVTLTNADKRNILNRRLDAGVWTDASAGVIARELGVSRVTVLAWIKRYQEENEVELDRSQVTGADGRTRQIGNIQTAAQERAKRPAPRFSPGDKVLDYNRVEWVVERVEWVDVEWRYSMRGREGWLLERDLRAVAQRFDVEGYLAKQETPHPPALSPESRGGEYQKPEVRLGREPAVRYSNTVAEMYTKLYADLVAAGDALQRITKWTAVRFLYEMGDETMEKVWNDIQYLKEHLENAHLFIEHLEDMQAKIAWMVANRRPYDDWEPGA